VYLLFISVFTGKVVGLRSRTSCKLVWSCWSHLVATNSATQDPTNKNVQVLLRGIIWEWIFGLVEMTLEMTLEIYTSKYLH